MVEELSKMILNFVVLIIYARWCCDFILEHGATIYL